MINRYEIKEIAEIWSEKNKFEIFKSVELALLQALCNRDIISEDVIEAANKAVINPERIAEIEKETKHDVIAFCTSITEQMPKEMGRFFHFGVTSSDVIDTALMLQIKQSLEIIIDDFKLLLDELFEQAKNHKDQMCIGRSHGIYAEPMSFGQKLLGHYVEFNRRFDELQDFYNYELTGQISGAVGNYTIVDPDLEEDVLNELGLTVEPVSTQVIPRDRIAKLISIFSLYSCALERLTIEIRHLQHSDVGEVFEGFSKGQKGSSTMPHKKNPISCENLSGLARVLRSHANLALENTLLWHERDISHSSAERLFLPDAMGLMSYTLRRLKDTVANLVVNKENMEGKLEKNFTYLSSYILHKLIEISEVSREEIYAKVQSASFEGKNPGEFYNKLSSLFTNQKEKELIDEISKMSIKEIYSKHTDTVFGRI